LIFCGKPQEIYRNYNINKKRELAGKQVTVRKRSSSGRRNEQKGGSLAGQQQKLVAELN
jgi:hypothetical protein